MTRAGRRFRSAATVVVACLLLAGTFWGDDDHFPFGPFRMYSTTNDVNGTVNTIRFRATDAAGNELEPRAQDFALRPAEVNGQVTRFRSDPALLRHLADSYERVHPDRHPLVRVELLHGLHQLSGGRAVAYSEEEIATWQR